MNTRKFQLTPEEIKQLRRAFYQCHDGPTRTRYQAVRMYGTGYALPEIQELTACSTTALMEWCHAFRHGGVTALLDQRQGGNAAKLTAEQRVELQDKLHQYTPHDLFGLETQTPDGQFWTVEDLSQVLTHWFDVQYASRTSYCNLFRACGFSYHRPAKVFKSQRPLQMADFEAEVEKK